VNANPVQLNFVVATVGQSSVAQTVTVTNSGTLAAAGLTLTTASPFSLTENTCGTSLAAGASCTAGVAFTPAANGSFSDALTIGSSTYAPAVVALTGLGGQAGSASLLPTLLTFATTGAGQASAAQTVTVTNTGAVTLSSLALSAAAGFEITGTTCGTSLSAGANCTVNVVFAPVAAGAQTGTLSVSSSSLPASVQSTLTGMGFDFALSTLTPDSFSVASGQITQYKLTVTPLNGSSGTFTFACGTLPAHTMCSFNPASVAAPANANTGFTLIVSTGVATASAQPPQVGPARDAPFALCLVLLPFAARRRRKALLWVALLAVAIAGLSSCAAAGGSSTVGDGDSKNATPAGTYTIAVTATSNGVSHTANVTLTVD
jgi:hypothetical protein